MGIFNRKPKVSVEAACRDFYDKNIFKAELAGRDPFNFLLQIYWDYLLEADKLFGTIPFAKFKEEMTALRIELFGLAWDYKFRKFEYGMQSSIFTKQYLEESGNSSIWEIMGEYNRLLANTATKQDNGEPKHKSYLVVLDKMKLDAWNHCIEPHKGDDNYLKAYGNCIARMCNRIGVECGKPNCYTANRLMAALADRLQCDININPEVLFRMQVQIYGMYAGALEAVESI